MHYDRHVCLAALSAVSILTLAICTRDTTFSVYSLVIAVGLITICQGALEISLALELSYCSGWPTLDCSSLTFFLRCSNRILVSGEWGKCIVLTNVSMDDNGRFLSFQLQSPQDSRVSSVNYTLHVMPSVEGEQLACGVVVLMCTKLCDGTV